LHDIVAETVAVVEFAAKRGIVAAGPLQISSE